MARSLMSPRAAYNAHAARPPAEAQARREMGNG